MKGDSMSGTAMIHDLVRDGRATPEQGAAMIQLRRELAASREKKARRRHPITNAFIAVGAFFLLLAGIIKRDSAV